MRSLIALLATTLPVLAEPPRLSLIFGQDALEAQAEDILDTRRVDEASGSTLSIRLAPAFDAAILALTAAHVGETGRLMICAEVVIEPVLFAPIDQAVFQISDADPARIDQLQAMLARASCDKPPGG